MCQMPKLPKYSLARAGWEGSAARGEGAAAQGLGLLHTQCTKAALNEFFILLAHFMCVLTPVLVPSSTAVLAGKERGDPPVPFPVPTGKQAASCGSPAFLSQVRALVAQQQGSSQVEVFHF